MKKVKNVVSAHMLVDTKILSTQPKNSWLENKQPMQVSLEERLLSTPIMVSANIVAELYQEKNAFKVERSAAYFERFFAMSLVANILTHRVLVQVS